jgi:hypothetical protein
LSIATPSSRAIRWLGRREGILFFGANARHALDMRGVGEHPSDTHRHVSHSPSMPKEAFAMVHGAMCCLLLAIY